MSFEEICLPIYSRRFTILILKKPKTLKWHYGIMALWHKLINWELLTRTSQHRKKPDQRLKVKRCGLQIHTSRDIRIRISGLIVEKQLKGPQGIRD